MFVRDIMKILTEIVLMINNIRSVQIGVYNFHSPPLYTVLKKIWTHLFQTNAKLNLFQPSKVLIILQKHFIL